MPSIMPSKEENIISFFDASRKNPFVIPAYQRSYAWEKNEVEELFNDLKDFNEEEMNRQKSDPNFTNETYFLGSIFFFENESGEREIIDGQQRIISLFLLFRAIYDRLKDSSERKRDLKKIIWKTDPISGEVISPDQVLISSQAISDEANRIFNLIIATGNSEVIRTDNYSQNYRALQNLTNELSKDDLIFENFVYRILNCTIVLPIQASDFKSTLEIFERINDRGKPLSDPDIFKAKIYESLDESMRENFINQWKALEQRISSVDESMKTLFSQYIYFIRAKNGDKTTNGDLKKYFIEIKPEALKDPNLLIFLNKLTDVICVAKNRYSIDEIPWSQNFEIRKAIDIIWSANGEWWKYPALVYYLANFKTDDFEQKYLRFLHKLIAMLSRIHVASNANAIKTPIATINVASIHSSHPAFPNRSFDYKILRSAFESGNNFMRTWLSILAYNEPRQSQILDPILEIEHIIPKNWQKNFVINSEQIHLIDEIGNLTLLEKNQNRYAQDSSFMKKRNFYQNSPIEMTRKLAERVNWGIADIENRNRELVDQLFQIFDRWDSEY